VLVAQFHTKTLILKELWWFGRIRI